jgi:hypothetical protein
MIPEKTFFLWVLVLIGMFLFGVSVGNGHTHDTHVSRPESKLYTNVKIEPCPILSGYMVQSDQRRCFIAYKVTDLVHTAVHIQDMNLNEDGECVCPKIER